MDGNRSGRLTVHELKNIEAWRGEKQWDVIHFGWGIWDANRLKDEPE